MLKYYRYYFSWNYGVQNIFSFGFIKALDLEEILNSLKNGIMSAVECTDETLFHFCKSDGANNTVCVDQVMWCLQ